MPIYADTNFFTALYCAGPNQPAAIKLHATAIRLGAAYSITMLGRLEFINALQQAVFATRQGVPGIRLTAETALAIEAGYFHDLADGERLREARCDSALLEDQFQTLSHRHTAKEGFRAYDVLHVASALVLGCDTFWSFDLKARKLAKLEGLKVNS